MDTATPTTAPTAWNLFAALYGEAISDIVVDVKYAGAVVMGAKVQDISLETQMLLAAWQDDHGRDQLEWFDLSDVESFDLV